MSISRRNTIALIGGGVIVAAAASTGIAVLRSPQTAFLPWARAGGYDDPRKRALSYAILAPNPHNRQPWMVDLSVPDQATLYVDTSRLLPHTDPFDRQITIGLGCFLEVMRLAALDDGLDVTFDLFPQGANLDGLDSRPVAVCNFAPTTRPADPLFAQVPHRRTLKEPYDISRPVPTHALERIAASTMFGSRVGFTTDAKKVAAMRELSTKALMIEFRTPRTYKESVDLFRIGQAEIDANPDGIDLGGPTFEALRLAGLFSREKALDTEGMSYQAGEKMVTESTMTAMAHLWQISPDNSRMTQIKSGQDWVRLNLAATAEGIGLQPLSQGLQEYPEMAQIYATLHETLAPSGGTVQMWCRLGYGPDVPVSPRWPLESKLLNV